MNRTNSIQEYYHKEQAVFRDIPGMAELMRADGDAASILSAQYPDAAFALSTANSLFQHDRELSLIYQRAYFSILDGETIPDVRRRHEREIAKYLQKRMWDD